MNINMLLQSILFRECFIAYVTFESRSNAVLFLFHVGELNEEIFPTNLAFQYQKLDTDSEQIQIKAYRYDSARIYYMRSQRAILSPPCQQKLLNHVISFSTV